MQIANETRYAAVSLKLIDVIFYHGATQDRLRAISLSGIVTRSKIFSVSFAISFARVYLSLFFSNIIFIILISYLFRVRPISPILPWPILNCIKNLGNGIIYVTKSHSRSHFDNFNKWNETGKDVARIGERDIPTPVTLITIQILSKKLIYLRLSIYLYIYTYIYYLYRVTLHYRKKLPFFSCMLLAPPMLRVTSIRWLRGRDRYNFANQRDKSAVEFKKDSTELSREQAVLTGRHPIILETCKVEASAEVRSEPHTIRPEGHTYETCSNKTKKKKKKKKKSCTFIMNGLRLYSSGSRIARPKREQLNGAPRRYFHEARAKFLVYVLSLSLSPILSFSLLS